MRDDLEIQLVTECPNLYRDVNGNLQEPGTTWGIECLDGWFGILHDASLELERLIADIPEEHRADYRALRVKEKFGLLRIEMFYVSDEMLRIIDRAGEKSAVVCEVCGEVGELYGVGGWNYVACSNHMRTR